jgi:hypothetical protein
LRLGGQRRERRLLRELNDEETVHMIFNSVKVVFHYSYNVNPKGKDFVRSYTSGEDLA